MSDEKVIDMPVSVPASAAENIPADTKPTIIIDKVLGSGDKSLYVLGDLEYLLGDVDEYETSLKELRGIPQDIAHISPDHPILAVIEELPEIKAMPKTTRTDVETRTRRIGEIVRTYFARLSQEATNSAIMLALTAKGNDNLPEPTPYEEPVLRNRPGLITLPSPKKDVAREPERRLKQVLDRVVQIPGALGELNEAIELMAIDVRGRLQARDKNGFQSK